MSALSEAAAEFYLLCAVRVHIGDRLCQLGTHHKILPQEKRKSEEEGAWYREKKKQSVRGIRLEGLWGQATNILE